MSDSIDFLHADDFVYGHSYDFDPVYFIANYEIVQETKKAIKLRGKSHSRNLPATAVEIWIPKKAATFYGRTAYIKPFFHRTYEEKIREYCR